MALPTAVRAPSKAVNKLTAAPSRNEKGTGAINQQWEAKRFGIQFNVNSPKKPSNRST